MQKKKSIINMLFFYCLMSTNNINNQYLKNIINSHVSLVNHNNLQIIIFEDSKPYI